MTSDERINQSNRLLELLTNGEASHLESFIFNARFELRAITETEMFATLADGQLKNASVPMGEIRMSRDGPSPVVTIYCDPPKDAERAEVFGKGDAALFAKCAETLLRTTYAAVGLDVLPQIL